MNKNLVFIGSTQFMNSSLDNFVKNLSDEDFKYLVEEFDSENLELLKEKDAYPYEYMNSFERFKENKLAARKYFYSSTKDGKIGIVTPQIILIIQCSTPQIILIIQCSTRHNLASPTTVSSHVSQ